MGRHQVNGITVDYDLSGPADGPLVVLVPGLGQPASSWHLHAAPTLAQTGRRVLTYDLRGVEPTDATPAPYSVDQLADDLGALLDAQALGPGALIGYSLGGWITQRLAVRRPDLVSAAVLVASANPSSAWEKLRYPLGAEMARLELPPAYDVVEALFYLSSQQQQDDATVETWAAIFGAGDGWTGEGRAGQWDAAVAWSQRSLVDHQADWAALSVPTLVQAFEHDIDCPPKGARLAADAIAGARYVEHGGVGHLGVFDAADEVVGEWVAFLDSVSPVGSGAIAADPT